MLVDSDVLIWNLRGNQAARALLDNHKGFSLSAVTYMEMIQGLRNKAELKAMRQAIKYWRANIVPLDTDISARAMYLVEEYALSHSMQMADALIASTALSLGETLTTANDKHYRFIDGVDIQIFRP